MYTQLLHSYAFPTVLCYCLILTLLLKLTKFGTDGVYIQVLEENYFHRYSFCDA